MKGTLLFFILLFSSVLGYGQNCTLSVNLSSAGSNICPGASLVLTASPSGGTAPYSYAWSTGETTSSISVNKAGTYTVTVSDKTPGCQPVSKSITVTSATAPPAPTASNAQICSNNSTTLTATAPGGDYQWYSAASGGTFLYDGASYTTPALSQSTVYYVQTTIGGCTSSRTAVNVTVTGSPTVEGQTVCSGSAATLSASGATSYAWYDTPSGGNLLSTNSTYTTPALTQTTTYYVTGTTNGCTSSPIPVTATVTQGPVAPTAAGATICSGSTVTLHSNTSSGTVSWYNVPSGGTALITSPDYTTPPLTNTTTYYIESEITNCVSSRSAVTVTVNPIPTAPVTQTDSACYNSSITLTASTAPSGTYQWYDAAVGGTLLSTNVTYTTPALTNSTTYYVQTSNGSCTSSRTPINVVIKNAVTPPSAASPLICYNSSVTLTATSPGSGTYQWYDAVTGGNLLSSTSTYTTPVLTSNTTYYVETTVSGCTSSRTPVIVNIQQQVSPPTASGVTVCSGSATTLTATGSSSGRYDWYDSATGGNYLASGASFTTPALTSTTTYYVQTFSTLGCVSSRTAVTATVTPLPAPPTGTGATVCSGSSAPLTASGSGTIEWYSSATGGTALSTGNTYTTPALITNTTYYAQNNSGTCTSSRTAVTAQVIQGPIVVYSSGTYCPTATNPPAPAISNSTGGSFRSTLGLSINPVTGRINLSASTPGSYTVTYTSTAPCPSSVTVPINITSTPGAQFSYNGPYCLQTNDPFPTFASGSSAGTFTSSPGLVFVNTGTGQIDLYQSKAGKYTITNTISANGSCSAASDTATVILNAPVVISAGPNQTIYAGNTAQLAGSVSGATAKWTGGSGSFSDNTSPTAIYTPGLGETSATLTFTSDPSGPCGGASSSVVITIDSALPAPTAANQFICSGSSAVLTATAPGGNYKWYDAPTGGKLLNSGSSFTTPVLTTTTSYYVQTKVGNQTSSRTMVTVNVNSTQPPSAAPVPPVCQNSSATLTASGSSSGSYAWYDSPTGGNLLSTNNPYTTPPLTASTSFYVETTVQQCVSPRTKVDVLVNPLPNVTSASSNAICSGLQQNYAITSNIDSATYTWSRAQVTGISNLPVSNQSTSVINETLINTGATAVKVNYQITPSVKGCPGPVFNYVVTVNPQPAITSAANDTICSNTSTNYTISFSDPTTKYTWSRDTVAGIRNAPVSGQTGTIQEVLFNTTNAPVNVTYTFSYGNSTCTGATFAFNVTVKPQSKLTSDTSGVACSGVPQNYSITSNIPGTTFVWSRAAVQGISNGAVTNQTTPSINEALNNSTRNPVKVTYLITPSGCIDSSFKYIVTVNPLTTATTGTSNTPVCLGSTIQLNTPLIANSAYLWTGPNGFTSSEQNPTIPNATLANSGIYKVYLINYNCTGPAFSVNVTVDEPPLANAGPNQIACIQDPSIQLSGTVSGGTTTGIWTTAGTGTFSPSENQLNAQYIPSAQDKANGSVMLTLASTSKDNCTVSMSNMTITFKQIPAANAGPDQNICDQSTAVPLNGKILVSGGGTWSTSGTGIFAPSANNLNATYVPSALDISKGAVELRLTATSANSCYYPTDSMTVKFLPPPSVYAGGTRYVLKDNTITLNPVISESNVRYQWSPNTGINNDTIKNPTVTGEISRTYTLTVTDTLGCVGTDQTNIIVSPQLIIPNVITPNGDGINDYWDIQGLIAYSNATVDIFNRWGTNVFHSIGYPNPWDGTYNGQPLPAGTYYYVINTKYNNIVLSGYVAIVR